MDEKSLSHPGVPEDTYHALGGKTLWLFVFARAQAAMVLLLLTVVIFAVNGQPFLAKVPIPNFTDYIGFAGWIVFALFIILLLGTFLVAWLIYINYQFYLGEDALKIKRGVFNKEEVAIPYRQIQ